MAAVALDSIEHTIEPAAAYMLRLVLESADFKATIESWDSYLEGQVITEEMRQVFVTLGWLTPRDRRVTRAARS